MKAFCVFIDSITRKQMGLGILLSLAMFMVACGSSSDQVSVPPQPRVTIANSTTNMDQGAKQQFIASVTGASNTTVVWSVVEGSVGGTIDSQGVYTAPNNPGTFHVMATSAANVSFFATREVSVNAVVIALSPVLIDMEPGGTQQFTATVSGTVHREVIWSVYEGEGGSISNAGLYTAPLNPGTFHVTVMSATDRNAYSTIELTVATLGVVIRPRAAGVLPSSTRSFAATVQGCSDDRVTWSIAEGSAGGGITAAGVYTAPAQMGEYHLIATSIAHPAISSTAAVKVMDSGFTSAADMTRARTNHTATLMPNGDVLLVGGEFVNSSGYYEATADAEVYDHSTKTFRATGGLSSGRSEHTATLLTNGKVLITGGGIGGWMVLNSAELYDPATGKFATTGNMVYRRTAHSATLLANGKVLILGGVDSYMSDAPDPTENAEIYDPGTGTFSPLGRLTTPRFRHTATLLPDGRILVAGGSTNWVGLTTETTEIFDPANGTSVAGPSLAQQRESHTATALPDNRILVAGGSRVTDYLWEIFIRDTAEIFNAGANQWSPAISMISPRMRHTATLLADGTVLLAGGFTAADIFENYEADDAEVFDPNTGAFAVTGTMTRARAGHTATMLLDGKILITGGTGDKTTEVFSKVP